MIAARSASLFLLYTIGFTAAAAFAQEESPTPDQAAAIATAAEGLGSPRFDVRERSMRELWEIGLPARAKLEQLAVEGGAEAQMRARRVLRDFQYGVLPTTPPRLRQLIGKFRDGRGKQRFEAMEGLRGERALEVIENLISLEPNAPLRTAHLIQLVSDPAIIDDYAGPQQMVDLVQRVGGDQDAGWQRDTTAALVFSPLLVSTLAKDDQLDQLDQFVADQKPEDRSRYLTAFYTNSSSLQILIQASRHGFLLKMLQHETDSSSRNTLALRLFSQQQVTQRLAQRGGLIDTLGELPNHVDAATMQTLLQVMLRQSGTISAILTRSGFDGLLQLSQQIEDPDQRVDALAMIVANRTVIAQLKSEDKLGKIVDLATDQPDDVRRLAYLKAIVKANILNTLAAADAMPMVKDLWRRIEASEDPTLQHDAILRMVRIPNLMELIKDRAAAESLLEMIGTMDKNLLPNVLPVLVHNVDLMRFLSNVDLIDKLVAIHCDVPEPHRTRVLGQLVTKMARWERDPEQRMALLWQTVDRLPAEDRPSYLAALGRLRLDPAMARQLVSRLLHETPDDQRDAAIEAILQSRALSSVVREPRDLQALVDRLPSVDEKTLAMFSTLISTDQSFRRAILDAGHLATLTAQFCRLDPKPSAAVISRMLQSREAQNEIAKPECVARLIEIGTQLSEPDQKLPIFDAIVANKMGMQQLLEAERLEPLIELLKLPPTPQQNQSLSKLLGNTAVLTYLVQHNQSKLIVAIAQEDWPTTALQHLASRLFCWQFVGLIEKEDKLQDVHELLQSDIPPAVAAALANQVLAGKGMRRGFAEQGWLLPTFDMALHRDGLSDPAVHGLMGDRDALQVFVDAMRVKDLIEAALEDRRELSVARRGQGLFISTALLNQLLETQQIDVLYRAIQSQPNADDKSTILRAMVGQRYSISRLIQAGQFEPLWDLIQTEASQEMQPLLHSYVLAAAVDDSRAWDGKLQPLYVAIDGLAENPTRREAIGVLAGAVLSDDSESRQSHIAQIARWIDQQTDSAVAKLWSTRLVSAAGATTIVKAGRTDLLAELIKDRALQQSTVAMLTTQPETVAALQEANLLVALVEACNRSPQRAALRKVLLQSPAMAERLDLENQIRPWLKELFSVEGDSQRDDALRSVMRRKHLIRLAIQEGHFDTLAHWVQASGQSPSARSRGGAPALLFEFLSQPICIEVLESEKREDELVKALVEVGDPRQQYRLLSEGIHLRGAIECIARNGGLDPVMDVVEKLPATMGSALVQRWILSPNTLAGWIDNATPAAVDRLRASLTEQQMKAFIQLASMRSEESLRSKLAAEFVLQILQTVPQIDRQIFTQRIVPNPKVRWRLLEYGHYETLLQMIDQLSSAAAFRKELIYSDAGVLAHKIAHGEFDEAERLLQENTAGEIGRSDLAAFWLQRGLLPQRLAEHKDSPQLPYLLRANGQPEEAAQWAREQKNIPLATWIDAGAGRWDRAADQQQQILDGLVAAGHDDDMLRLSVLCGLASYQHMAKREANADETLDRAEQLADKIETPAAQVALMNCLLVNDRVDRALEIAKTHAPQTHFELLRTRGDYDAALQTVAWKPDDPAAWVAQRLNVDMQRTIPMEAVQIIANVGWILDQREASVRADALYAALSEQIHSQQKNPRRSNLLHQKELFRILRSSGRMALAVEPLLDETKRIGRANGFYIFGPMGQHTTASRRALERMGYLNTPRILQPAIADLVTEFDGWWSHFAAKSPSDADDQLLQRLQNVDAMLSGEGTVAIDGQTMSPEEYLAAELKNLSETTLTTEQLSAFVGSMLRFDRTQQAFDLMQQQREIELPAAQAGIIYRRLGKWSEAAEAFQQAWEDDVLQLEFRYLAADAVARSGDREAGAKQMQTASMMAVNFRIRNALTHRLGELGAQPLAAEEARLLQAVSPIGSFTWYKSCQRRADLETDPATVADLQQTTMLQFAGGWTKEIPLSDLASLHTIHRLRAAAAIEADDFEKAQQHIDRMFKLNRIDPQNGEQLIPPLRAAGRDKQADALQGKLIATSRSID
ncbi:hypothetical protein Poly24_54640 [Rosistilla carotiformis]|uniref:HEAT repeat protein n=1 Tax=Rosistilla carotiformis TaxID=2528017 RepID=A0A518K1T2_9BACT|nr:hypothetical protein [Rosistilla carotiformis]QDV71725.1 hypothetical protein Poly24_54640 [Rosistilla carotiformis]